MFDQEDILKLILAQNWESLIQFLHKNKRIIESDTLIKYAAVTFENEFLKSVQNYSVSDEGISNLLEDLFVLHRGGFYKISDENT